jgi:hypothetical protein
MEIKKFQFVTIEDPNYEAAQALIESTYHKAFQSSVTPRPTMILTLADQSGSGTEVVACVTLSHGEGRSFFSERYLGEPAEMAIAKVLGWPVDRQYVMEVGGLAASQNGAGTQLVSHTPWFVLGLGYRYPIAPWTLAQRFLGMFRTWLFEKSNLGFRSGSPGTRLTDQARTDRPGDLGLEGRPGTMPPGLPNHKPAAWAQGRSHLA